MHIGIDYTAAVRQTAGIGRYARNLIRALAELDTENQYRLFVAGGWGDGDGCGPWPANFRVRAIPLTDRWMNILWQRFRLPLPIQLVTGPLDLFHSPDFVLPPTGRTPSMLTIHDLSFLRVPECFLPNFRSYLAAAVSRSVARAKVILADSKSTRRDLLELMQVKPDKVVVLYPGVERRFQPIRDPGLLATVRARYHLPERFVLGLGTLQPRKNFAGLVEGFRRLVARENEYSDLGDLQLVIAGGRGWMCEEIIGMASRACLEGRIHFTGFVSDADLPALYSMAEVFAFPSWYEGFGLPVLEAMACGTPVVAADNSSLPEVVGDAGLLVAAGDPDGLSDALLTLIRADSMRVQLAAKGPAQAGKFQWEGAGRQLLDLYRAAVL